MKLKDKKICILGLGYIGLPTAAILANENYNVNGVDIDKDVVNNINLGNTHFSEKDLDKLLGVAINKKKFKALEAPVESDIYIICVPTPFIYNNEVPEPDIQFINSAVDSITNLLKPEDIIILESTSPVGTTLAIRDKLEKKNINLENIYIAYCPERVLPGCTLEELVNNDRVVGGINDLSTNKVADFYETFVRGQVQRTNSKTAEMCKLIENSYRDVNIAFANEVSIICEKNNIDVWKLIKLANHHPRVNVLQPGCGVGGHCIAVDPWFIISQNFEQSKLIKAAREVNNYKPKWAINKIIKLIDTSKNKKNSKVVCFGATFKPNIDDVRESPAIEIVSSLLYRGFDVCVSDPNIRSYKDLKILDINKAIDLGEIFIFLVKHNEFLEESFKNKFANKKVLDLCGVFS
tara:strand:+ start:328 stop:1548 length:1221 start_codon:yes stop_codon:yes gene_type:complete